MDLTLADPKKEKKRKRDFFKKNKKAAKKEVKEEVDMFDELVDRRSSTFMGGMSRRSTMIGESPEDLRLDP